MLEMSTETSASEDEQLKVQDVDMRLNKAEMGSNKVQEDSNCEVAQLCLTLCNPMDCSPPGSSIHGIFQARILE